MFMIINDACNNNKGMIPCSWLTFTYKTFIPHLKMQSCHDFTNSAVQLRYKHLKFCNCSRDPLKLNFQIIIMRVFYCAFLIVNG